ncbi:trophozoite cysteine proteinase-like [Coccinella septempunctata]|uniref:trophozoite cysteine proteinase-like n=1 Tax=Coccinella septempunctata TaxID=41139 RepID=UPI001D08E8B8|nr:trophozoite cysteine proteinase-like [Coccinella septempunctata]
MRGFIVFLFFVPFLCVQALTEDEVERQWQEYLQQYKKSYRSPVEKSRRFSIFKYHLEEIENNNRLFNEGKASFKKGINEFSDWTDEEFKEYVSHGLISEGNILNPLIDVTGEIYESWKEFQSKYKKTYRSPVETKKRFEIFKNNYVKMLDHNGLYEQGLVSDRLGINQFSDWTQEEFKDFVNKGLIPCEDADILRRWEDFKRKFNKSYQSITETEERFNIFKSNVRMIDEHNRLYKLGKFSYLMGINQFADWTNEEYKEWVRTH